MVKILIAEDDLMIADMIEETLVSHGYQVCGMARTVGDALDLCRRHGPDLVLIDLRLAEGGLGTDIAAQLTGPARPGILYATGNVTQMALTASDGQASLVKPYRAQDLLRSLDIVSEILATGKAQPPFPRGFQVLRPPHAAYKVLHGE